MVEFSHPVASFCPSRIVEFSHPELFCSTCLCFLALLFFFYYYFLVPREGVSRREKIRVFESKSNPGSKEACFSSSSNSGAIACTSDSKLSTSDATISNEGNFWPKLFLGTHKSVFFSKKVVVWVCTIGAPFLLQQTQKVGHWQVARLRIYCNTRQAKTALISTEELQHWGFSMAIFSYLLQQKFAPNFQLKQPLFLEKETKKSCLPIWTRQYGVRGKRGRC